jgi:hypothetical protein
LKQQVSDAMGERIGFARAGAGDDQKRPGSETVAGGRTVEGSPTLSGIQSLAENFGRRLVEDIGGDGAHRGL